MDIKNNNNLKNVLILLSIFCLALLANLPATLSVWEFSFDDGTYSHAYLIPFIVIYLLFDIAKKGQLKARKKIAILPSIALFVTAYLVFVTSLAQFSYGIWLGLLLLLLAITFTVFRFNLLLGFAISYFIFLLPVWGVLVTPLQNLSVMAVTIIMNLTPIPVFVQNEFVEIPSGTFEIAGGCSGLRYFITSLAISSLYIVLYIKSLKHASIFMTIAILGALVTNWIRITLLIVIGHQTEMTSSLMEDHNTFGWYIFLPFMFLLFMLGNKFESNTTDSNDSTAEKSSPNARVLGITLLVVVAFSSQWYTENASKPTTTELPKNLLLTPTVKYFNNLEVLENKNSNTSLLFSFDSSSLKSSPTYYENEMIPEGWQVIHSEYLNNQTHVTIKQSNKQANIIYHYRIGDEQYASKGQFKKARLINALTGNSHTKLYWQIRLVRG